MIIVLISLSLFGCITLAAVAALSRPKTSVMETRIASFKNRSVLKDDLSVDLDVAFSDRILRPGVESIARNFSKILPQSALADVQHQLLMAGNPMKYNTFITFWAVSLFGMTGVGLMMLVAGPGGILPRLALAVFFTAMGYVFPRFWLKGKVKAKQKLVLKALPDALDLITTCVEAGLGLDAALQRVGEKSEGPLADELQRMLRDVSMGKLRREAMTELGQRIGVEELTNFINAIIQAEQLGVGIAQVLRVQSDQLRTQRRQRAERQAHEAPIKMIFPLVLFIFPSFLAVILGPAAIRIAQAFS